MEFEPIIPPGSTLDRPLIIAGPCSAETEEQVMETARQLAAAGITIFRAGIWKPRTKPGGFEGVGVAGLPWLRRVKQELGMLTATEVATAHHVYEALKYGVDMLWIGARTTANPFAVQEIADALRGVDIPVLVKNPVNPDVDLWIGAIERLYQAGIRRIAVIHRGFSNYDKNIYRNAPHWNIPIELHRRLPNIPILCDPSHICGKRELIFSIAQQAMDLNFNGLIIESHCDPDQAWSDSEQQVKPQALEAILRRLVVRKSNQTTDDLEALRRHIDELDIALINTLARRMKVSEQIGTYKKEHNMPVLQSTRYDQILAKRVEMGNRLGMSQDFMLELFEAIHEESVRIQLDVINHNSPE